MIGKTDTQLADRKAQTVDAPTDEEYLLDASSEMAEHDAPGMMRCVYCSMWVMRRAQHRRCYLNPEGNLVPMFQWWDATLSEDAALNRTMAADDLRVDAIHKELLERRNTQEGLALYRRYVDEAHRYYWSSRSGQCPDADCKMH